MARRFRTPKAPKEKVELVYELSSAIAEVASRLIRLYPAKFGWTTNFKLGYVLVRGAKRKSDDRIDAMARFKKVPPVYHGLTGYDAVVEVYEWAWNQLVAETQEALVAHELCHGSMSEKGTLRVEKHDLEEFRFVVGQWGAWKPDIAAFEDQLTLFAKYGPGYRTPSATQTKAPLDDDTDLRPTGDVNADALRGEADRAVVDEPTPIRGKRANGNGQAASPVQVKVGDPLVVDGTKLRVKTIGDGTIHAKASFGDQRWSGAAAELAWDDGAGAWRVAGA